MLLKIKNKAIPISLKMTLIYVGILSITLLATNMLTLFGQSYVLFMQADEDITITAASVREYLEMGHPFDEEMIKMNVILPGIAVQAFNSDNKILVNTVDAANGKRWNEKERDEVTPFVINYENKLPLHIVEINGSYFYFVEQIVTVKHQSYKIHYLKAMGEQAHFLKVLSKSLLATSVLGILCSVFIGIYMSRKMLRPIRDITNTAKEIECNDLSKRIKTQESNDELQELSCTFNHMLDRIQAAFEKQNRFVADASHELRTPITVISGYADMLDRWGKKEADILDESIVAIKSEAENMNKLIEKLLFLAQVDQEEQILKRHFFDMNNLLSEITQETRIIAPNHEVDLVKNDHAIVYADLTYIKEMIRIFIENSIKYTPEKGKITISSVRLENCLEILILDTGIGISEEDQEKIFDRFYRSDASRNKSSGGIGLGLAIAKWIAEKHEIALNVFSNVGEGTTVLMKVPLSESEEFYRNV